MRVPIWDTLRFRFSSAFNQFQYSNLKFSFLKKSAKLQLLMDIKIYQKNISKLIRSISASKAKWNISSYIFVIHLKYIILIQVEIKLYRNYFLLRKILHVLRDVNYVKYFFFFHYISLLRIVVYIVEATHIVLYSSCFNFKY